MVARRSETSFCRSGTMAAIGSALAADVASATEALVTVAFAVEVASIEAEVTVALGALAVCLRLPALCFLEVAAWLEVLASVAVATRDSVAAVLASVAVAADESIAVLLAAEASVVAFEELTRVASWSENA